MNNWRELATIRPQHRFGMSNGGWAYDAYPELETLDAGRAITIAQIEGPGVITQIHTTQHIIPKNEFWQVNDEIPEPRRKALAARGVVIEVYYNGATEPAVRVPLGDFFADGCGGRAQHFSTPFVEKAPESYNCFIPMPFAHSARVVLRNDTPFNLGNYSFVEFEQLPAWDESLGYFHAAWQRDAFQLHGDTDQPFFHVDGCGHLVGRAWSVCTDEPLFDGFGFVMEGNNEVRIDGEPDPRADYLGSEDSFGFSWGFQRLFTGQCAGINYVQNQTPSQLSIFRFHAANAIRFTRSLDWRVDWSHEFRTNADFQRRLAERREAGHGWVDYATTWYWYQQAPGFAHTPLPDLEQRVAEVLRTNA
jgi:hypothetical protein